MEDILLLVHRIPFPPNKGDKIRSFHLLKHLAGRYNVHLAAFIDHAADWQHVDELEKFCKSTYFRPLRPGLARLKSLRGFLNARALSLPYYRDGTMQKQVDAILRDHEIRQVICYSSVMSQYVSGPEYSHLVRIADFVDMDSDKWRQYSSNKSFPMKLVYARESARLLEFERQIASEFASCLFVSAREAELFASHVPGLEHRIGYYNNGVDFDRFDPARQYSNPLDPQVAAIVFTGAMDYWANIDAVCWFAREILPRILEQRHAVRFYIVGSNPSAQVQGLADNPAVTVTGEVPDTRPYLAFADLVVAPLRIARGIQNKVLESLAMGKPVVLTRAALEGIDDADIFAGLVVDDPQGFADACIRQLETGAREDWGRRAREFVKREYSWESNLVRLDRCLAAP